MQPARGNIGRNAAIGIKTKYTRDSDRAWLVAHQTATPWFAVAAWTGYFTAALAVVLCGALLATGFGSAAGLTIGFFGYTSLIVLNAIGGSKGNKAAKGVAGEHPQASGR